MCVSPSNKDLAIRIPTRILANVEDCAQLLGEADRYVDSALETLSEAVSLIYQLDVSLTDSLSYLASRDVPPDISYSPSLSLIVNIALHFNSGVKFPVCLRLLVCVQFHSKERKVFVFLFFL